MSVLWDPAIPQKDFTVSISMPFKIWSAILIPMRFYSLSTKKTNSALFAKLLTAIRSLPEQKMYISETGDTVLTITWRMSWKNSSVSFSVRKTSIPKGWSPALISRTQGLLILMWT